eukprot:78823-Chlamydomonas_euryale.AAC.2
MLPRYARRAKVNQLLLAERLVGLSGAAGPPQSTWQGRVGPSGAAGAPRSTPRSTWRGRAGHFQRLPKQSATGWMEYDGMA